MRFFGYKTWAVNRHRLQNSLPFTRNKVLKFLSDTGTLKISTKPYIKTNYQKFKQWLLEKKTYMSMWSCFDVLCEGRDPN